MQLEMQMVPRARKSDPVTSHEAAGSQRETLAEKQAKVLALFQAMNASFYYGPLCDDELSCLCEVHYGWPRHKSTARTRRAELTELGKIVWTGEYVTLSSGRRAKTWRAA